MGRSKRLSLKSICSRTAFALLFAVVSFSLAAEERQTPDAELKAKQQEDYEARQRQKIGGALLYHKSGFVRYPSQIGGALSQPVGIPLTLALFPVTLPLGLAIPEHGMTIALGPMIFPYLLTSVAVGGAPYLVYESLPSSKEEKPRSSAVVEN